MSRRILPQRGYRGAPRVSTRVSTLGLNFWIAKVGLEEDAAFFVVLVLPRRRTRARHRRAHTRPRGRLFSGGTSEIPAACFVRSLLRPIRRRRARVGR